MSNINWETRAKDRRLENKFLKKKIKELTISRDLWKGKYIVARSSLVEVKKKIETVKKNVQQIVGL
jgi:hypothetical protein